MNGEAVRCAGNAFALLAGAAFANMELRLLAIHNFRKMKRSRPLAAFLAEQNTSPFLFDQ